MEKLRFIGILAYPKIASRQSAKEGTIPLPFRAKRAENYSHNLGKALGEGLGHKFSYRRNDL